MLKTAFTMILTGLLTAGLDAAETTTVADAHAVVMKLHQYDWLLKHPTIQALVTKTNAHRAQFGLSKVRLNTDMCLAAQRHAKWMAETGAYQHSSLPYLEIIFTGPTTADGAIQGWIASPAHHGIMLSGSEVGFGYMVRNGQHYWVGVFR